MTLVTDGSRWMTQAAMLTRKRWWQKNLLHRWGREDIEDTLAPSFKNCVPHGQNINKKIYLGWISRNRKLSMIEKAMSIYEVFPNLWYMKYIFEMQILARGRNNTMTNMWNEMLIFLSFAQVQAHYTWNFDKTLNYCICGILLMGTQEPLDTKQKSFPFVTTYCLE